MDMNIELYVEINGVKYQIDPTCCTLEFTLNKSKNGESSGCLEVIVSGGDSVCLDIVWLKPKKLPEPKAFDIILSVNHLKLKKGIQDVKPQPSPRS